MRDFQDKVAVVTGAARGIGLALAGRCCNEGIRVVLADVEEDALRRAQARLEDAGGTVLSVLTNVAKAEEVEALAERTLTAFGSVDLLFNNAGVAGGGPTWETSLLTWEWVLGVNLWGVIHGVRTFLPILLEQGSEAHIINIASIEGLWTRPLSAPYQVSKHGVVCLSEVMHHELTVRRSRVRVSVVCPGAVDTRILESDRNRPVELTDSSAPEMTPEAARMREELRRVFAESMSSAEVAEKVFRGIREEKLFILTHPEFKESVRKRMESILEERNPDIEPLPLPFVEMARAIIGPETSR